MQFAMTTDHITSTGPVDVALRPIAAGGWKLLHWCHHWNDDFVYDPAELRQIKVWLDELGLGVLDIHGSAGFEKAWDSAREYERLAGLALVRNRLEMAAELGCGVIIMHPARIPTPLSQHPPRWDALRRSLDALQPDLTRLHVRIAMENMPDAVTFDQLDALMEQYPPDRVGVCYDPGHGCIAGNGLDRLEKVAGRLIAMHLNDNDAAGDLHQPLFMGKVDWPRLAKIVRGSGYDRSAISVEVVMKHSGIADEAAFLERTLESALRFGALVDAG